MAPTRRLSRGRMRFAGTPIAAPYIVPISHEMAKFPPFAVKMTASTSPSAAARPMVRTIACSLAPRVTLLARRIAADRMAGGAFRGARQQLGAGGVFSHALVRRARLVGLAEHRVAVGQAVQQLLARMERQRREVRRLR